MSCLAAPGGPTYKAPHSRGQAPVAKMYIDPYPAAHKSNIAPKRPHDNVNYPQPPAHRVKQADSGAKPNDLASVMSRHPVPGRQRSNNNEARTLQEKRSAAVKQLRDWRPGKSLQAIPEAVVAATTDGKSQTPNSKVQNPDPTTYRGLDSRWSKILSYDSCCEGMIIRSAVHEQDFQNKLPEGSVNLDGQYTINTNFGLVYSKLRWQIIISKKLEHYITVPLYTHDGKGLQKKNSVVRKEYLSIRDQRQRGETINLTPYEHIDAHMFHETTILKPESVVRLTYPVNGKYDLAVEVLGLLPKESLSTMKMIYNRLNRL